MKKKNKLKSEDKVILFILTVIAVVTVAYSTYLYSNQTKEGVARGESSVRTAKVIDKSSPPKIPEISGVPISSEKGSLEIASTDFAEYCTSIGGTYNSANDDCTFPDGNVCAADTLLNGNCRYGIGIPAKSTDGVWGFGMMGFSNKPETEASWDDILDNWGIPGTQTPTVFSYDSVNQKWKVNNTWSADYDELDNYIRESDNGFIIFNSVEQNKFLTYPADWSRDSFLLHLNPGWNLISTNISRPITAQEFFNPNANDSTKANYLRYINSVWVYDYADENDTDYVLLYDGTNLINPEYNLTPGMAFWVNVKDEIEFNFEEIPFPLCTLDQGAVLDECTLQ